MQPMGSEARGGVSPGGRRNAWVAAAMLLALAVWPLRNGQAAHFKFNQMIDCHSDAWSFVGIWNHTTGAWTQTVAFKGSVTVGYTLPYGAWQSIWIYDYSLGAFDEVLHMIGFDL